MPSLNGNGAVAPSLGLSGLISIGEAAKLVSKHPNSIRSACLKGLPSYRVQGGWRMFDRSQLLSWYGIREEKSNEKNFSGGQAQKILGYIRISNSSRAKGFYAGNEDSDMARQKNRVTEFAQNNYGIAPIIFSDIGSGLSFGQTRKGLTRLLKEVLAGQHDGSILLVSTKERLARFGTELIELICEAHSVIIKYTDSDVENESEAQELSQDLMAIIHVFSSRSYAMRYAKRAKKHLSEETLGRIRELRKSGMAIARVVDQVNREGHRTLETNPVAISIQVTRRLLAEAPQLEISKDKSSIEHFAAECLETAPDNVRLKKVDLYAEYLKWGKNKGINVVSRNQAGRQLKAIGLREQKVSSPNSGTQHCWAGVRIKIAPTLSFTIIPKPRITTRATQERIDNFTVFYHSHLRGKFQGTRGELNRQYLAWCVENGHKKISLREIPKILIEHGAYSSFRQVNNKKGFIYQL